MGSSDPQDGARMVAQARLVEAYECAQWPCTAPALPVLLSYLMDQHNLSRADLVPLLGAASRVSEVLTDKRDLSMTMVRRLREQFNVSAACWFREAAREASNAPSLPVGAQSKRLRML
jgi:HTH-type transcriptional regulator / antitoxin HigA